MDTTSQLTVSDLRLCGTDEPFYLNEGETVLWIRDNGDGTATVRLRFPDGIEDVIDADIAPTPHTEVSSMSTTYSEGDRVFISPRHEAAPGWFARVVADGPVDRRSPDPVRSPASPMVMVLPESGDEGVRWLHADVVSPVRS